MRRQVSAVVLFAGFCLGIEARAAFIQFDTLSTATQDITSPLLGGTVHLVSPGPQHFTFDTTLGTATVTSAFTGSDFPDPTNPGHFVTYNLYNTLTTGTVTTEPSGSFDIKYQLLFELDITSGALAGFQFSTQKNANFDALNAPTLPFLAGTSFSDPGGSDAVNIYVKFDPTGTYAAGTLVGSSSNRVVTVNHVIPEPSTMALSATGLGLLLVRRRRPRRSA